MHGGTLVPPWLGAQGDTVDSKIAKALGLDRPKGVLIGEVYPGGPAAKAGIKKGDVVLSVDGRDVFDEKGMKFVAATKAEGDKVSVVTLRSGHEQSLSVKLEAPPGTSKADLIQVSGNNPFSGAQVARTLAGAGGCARPRSVQVRQRHAGLQRAAAARSPGAWACGRWTSSARSTAFP